MAKDDIGHDDAQKWIRAAMSVFSTDIVEHLDAMAAAYIKATGIPIEECELVIEQTFDPVGWKYYFRRKEQ